MTRLKHGGSGSRLYRLYQGMLKRCNSPRATNAKYYYDKGIKVCEEWLDFAVFREWALENGYTDGLTLERNDSDKNYEPKNCEWITLEENARRANAGRTRKELALKKRVLTLEARVEILEKELSKLRKEKGYLL